MSRERLFHFKQFSVSHSLAAMKIGTDGVMLGAWAPLPSDCRTIWDAGSGSGLIALMMAQREPNAEIFAIEIDHDAAKEMEENLRNSPWTNRLHAIADDVCQAAHGLLSPDLIVSNPPFFANSLKTPDSSRNLARHEATLGFESLIALAAQHLAPSGLLAMISPADRAADIEWLSALHRLHIVSRINVSTHQNRQPSRILWALSKSPMNPETENVCIRETNDTYSNWYRSLTAEFYTHLK